MAEGNNDEYEYCCGFMDIRISMYVIPVYTIIHGVYGLCIVVTSYYVDYCKTLHLTATFMSCLFILLGVCLFIVPLFLSEIASKVLGVTTTIMAICYFSVCIWYFAHYVGYFANSMLDRLFFWKYGYCWAGPEFAFTFWHILTFYLIVFTPMWIYFGYVIYNFGERIAIHAEEYKEDHSIYYVYRQGSTSGQPVGYLQTAPAYGRGYVQPLPLKANSPPPTRKEMKPTPSPGSMVARDSAPIR